MKGEKPRPRKKAASPDFPLHIREDAAQYGLRRDVLGVRAAKDQWSNLLKRAADGEEIVIASDGVPVAMIVGYKPAVAGKPYRPNWTLLKGMRVTSNSTPGIRAERDGAP